MKQENAKFTLKLSREKIQLLFITPSGVSSEIGYADPNKSDINANLLNLRNQVQALTGKHPLVDVMLPDELILIQNLTIESATSPLSKVTATEQLAKACKLKESEINVAIGVPTSHRTQPVAAVTTKTLDETRYFLNSAGFNTGKFMSSKAVSGFDKPPIFTREPIERRGISNFGIKPNLTIVMSVFAFAVIAISTTLITKPFQLSEPNYRGISTIIDTIPSSNSIEMNKITHKPLIMSPDLPPNINKNRMEIF